MIIYTFSVCTENRVLRFVLTAGKARESWSFCEPNQELLPQPNLYARKILRTLWEFHACTASVAGLYLNRGWNKKFIEYNRRGYVRWRYIGLVRVRKEMGVMGHGYFCFSSLIPVGTAPVLTIDNMEGHGGQAANFSILKIYRIGPIET